MAFEFHLPDLAEGMVEAEVVAWKVKEGDPIKLDQPLVEVMSDKATVEIPSPRSGRMAKIFFEVGQVCPVGGVLFAIDEDGAEAAAPKAAAPPAAKPAAPPAAKPAAPPVTPPPSQPAVRAEIPGSNGNGHPRPTRVNPPGARPPLPPPREAPRLEVIDASAGRARVLATPATRKLARTVGVDLAAVPATGSRGRVTSDDVRRFAEGGRAELITTRDRPEATLSIVRDEREERIPFRGMRKRIADNMARSKQTAAHFTYVEDVDTTELVALRDKVRQKVEGRGVKLTYLPFFMKAVVAGLKKWPALNASLDEAAQEIVRKKYYHLGIAAQGPQGLVVTVVRDVDRRSIVDLAMEVDRLAVAVQSGSATREDLTGSTFTISSLGKLGGVLATPIINHPEVGILGIHKMEQRAVVRDGNIVARWMLNLSVSLDHRLVDGWDGAMFLQEVKALLEDPTLLFMEMA